MVDNLVLFGRSMGLSQAAVELQVSFADQQVSVAQAQAQVVAGGQLVIGGQQPTVSQELSSRVGS